eukprot:TRINITY_DN3363_c0_g2_i1.p1 TRINITY_DN3363_c0_g2~~TRINITY_DN3363_c0_g2_i1.p1  ORF type:complete len:306 (-),score=70.39 TRINITY_DN3363_c0_g2_i1:374-1291(-)
MIVRVPSASRVLSSSGSGSFSPLKSLPINSRARFISISSTSCVLRDSQSSPTPSALLHFLGANGFPAGTYSHFLAQFQPHFSSAATDVYHHVGETWVEMIDHVVQSTEKQLKSHPEIVNQSHTDSHQKWHDTRQHASNHKASSSAQGSGGNNHPKHPPLIGIGHSLGGALTYCASVKRPDLYSGIVLIDPPFYSQAKRLLFTVLSSLGAGEVHPLIRNTLNRRNKFSSKEEAADHLRKKKLFQKFHPQVFDDFLQHGIIVEDESSPSADSPASSVHHQQQHHQKHHHNHHHHADHLHHNQKSERD